VLFYENVKSWCETWLMMMAPQGSESEPATSTMTDDSAAKTPTNDSLAILHVFDTFSVSLP